MKNDPLSPELLEEQSALTLAELCLSFRITDVEVRELVAEGIIDQPIAEDAGQWRFQGSSLRRIRCALQLNRDLGVNWAGAALALELLDELKRLRIRLQRHESYE